MLEIITTHSGADFDALASTLAARKLYPKAKICLPGSVAREVKQFLRLYGKIIPRVKMEEIKLDEVKRLILVDTRWINRIGIFDKLISKEEVEIHIYDHHPPHPQDIKEDEGICKEVGATTSILVQLMRERNIPIKPAEATLFALGIYDDTGSLSFASTTSLDLETAGFLLSRGANLELIPSFLNRGLTKKQVLLFNDFLKKARTYLINGVEVVVIVTEIEEFVGGLSAPLHKLIDLKNLEVVFALIKARERIYLIARSRTSSVNVSELLSPFGGGGHNFAASALIKEGDLKEIERRLYQILKERIRPSLTVREIMSRPVRIASPQTQAQEAKKIMEGYKIKALPVVEGGRIMGMISRERVEHLISHNSPGAPLKSYLSPRFATIAPHLSLKKAQEVMMEKEVERLLVLEEDKLMGIITGSDLLRAFHQGKKNSGEIKGLANLKQLLEKVVPEKIQCLLRKAGEVAEKMNYKAYAVGGFVRDLLLGIENLDIDLVIEGDGISFAAQLAEEWGGKLLRHQEFRTATLSLPHGFKLDIATSRREFYPEPASLPRVEPASLREDLSRRDFTVNAMAMDLSPSSFGRLMDFFGGKKDLGEGKVRALHEKSFLEDPTRVFRAIRFEQRYRFNLEEKTKNLIKEALKGQVFAKLSQERVRQELIQILEEERPERPIQRMQELGLLETIHPRMRLTEKRKKILDSLVDVFAWFETTSGRRAKRWLVRLLVLLEDLNEAEAEDFCQKYRFSKEAKNSIMAAKLQMKGIIKNLAAPQLTPSFIYHLLRPLPTEVLLLMLAKTREKVVKKQIFLYFSRLKEVEVEIDGNVLKNMGYKPSPRFKEILEEIKRAKLDGAIQTRKEEIEYLKNKFPPEGK